MKHAEQYEKLARLTGFPNLAAIYDPERLERLVAAADSSLAHCTLQCPLRYKVAYKEYAEAAAYRLEHPEEIE
ncbi:MAG TPA: hypothetical protein VN428_13985 [Bryobacteraceae bacterium]|nr:hypothetical protein [Bryobacteraceae bacterium]